MIKLPKIKCVKCGHERIPRVVKPLKCPVCGYIPGAKIRKKKTTPNCLQANRIVDKNLSIQEVLP
jgi:ribosomal protein L37E